MTRANAGLAAKQSGLQANIIGFAIRFRGIVLALALVLLGYGILSVVRAKYDVFPEFAPPQVGIQTEAPGLTPEQIEILVTQPIENAVNGVPGVQSLRSTSIQGSRSSRLFSRPEVTSTKIGKWWPNAWRSRPSNSPRGHNPRR